MTRYRFCPQCGEPLVTEERGGAPRRVCGAGECGFVHWNNPVPVVAAIVQMADGVVLVQNKGWPAKWFGLVTGFLEANETPAEAVLREVDEELGLQATIVESLGLYPFYQMNQLIIAYHVRADGDIVLGDELEAHKVIAIDKLVPWPMGTGPALRDWLEARRRPPE